MAKDSYIVTHELRRDGKVYDPGDTITLSESEAEHLLEEFSPPPIRKPEAVAESPAAAERVEALEAQLEEARDRVSELENAGDVLLTLNVDEQSKAIKDVENVHRLRGVLQEEDRTSAQGNLQSRIDELTEDEEG